MPPLREVLARAMEDDPFVRWLIGDRPARARAHERYVSIMLEQLAMKRGRVWVAADGESLRGAALFAPPHTFELDLADSLRLLPRMARVIGPLRFSRVSEVLAAIDDARPPEPRWLLTMLGVDGPYRGLGIGAALVRAGLAHADAEQLPAVAETATRENLAFYHRLGFAVTRERTLRESETRSWTLVRPARAAMLADGGPG